MRLSATPFARVALLVALSVAALAPAAAAPPEDATASVTRIYASTIEAGARPDRLAARLATSIDLDALSRKVLGPAYGKATPAERKDFKAVLLEVIALELSQRIRRDQDFEIIRSKALKGGDVVVFSRLTKADGTEKKLDWKMRPCGTRYCIYDLLGNNASFSAARRDDYAARLKAAGGSLAELTTALRAEVAARKCPQASR